MLFNNGIDRHGTRTGVEALGWIVTTALGHISGPHVAEKRPNGMTQHEGITPWPLTRPKSLTATEIL